VGIVSRSSAAWLGLGCISEALDLRLFLIHMGVAAMRQDCNYQLYTMKLGRKQGKKTIRDLITELIIEGEIDQDLTVLIAVMFRA
jgi:hypothetical protein